MPNFQEILELIKSGNKEAAQEQLNQASRENLHNIYNTANNTNIQPSAPNNGVIKQGPDKLYKNAYDRWTDNTAEGQEFKRFVNGPLKYFGETILGTFAGQELANGLKIPGTLMKVARPSSTASALIGTTGTSYFGAQALNSLFKDFTGKQEINPISTGFNMLMAAPVVGAASPALRQAGYAIEHLPGYQLRSLMRGNPLERQLSKNGSISVNSIQALANKASNVERDVINKVLAQKFAGQKSIDYNQFRKAVQEELITYDMVPDAWQRYADYGMSRLGFKVEEDPGSSSLPGIVEGAKPEVHLFSTSRIPHGNDAHYADNTLGHIRSYKLNDVPSKRFILENQSDWGQHPISKGYIDAEGVRYDTIEDFEEAVKHLSEHIPSYSEEFYPAGYDLLDENRRLLQTYKENPLQTTPQEQYLHDNYLQRQIQEALKLSAQRGETHQLYPTPETAAKIEGYGKGRHIPDELRDSFNERMKLYFQEEDKLIKQYLPKGYIDNTHRINSLDDEYLNTLSREELSNLYEASRISDEFDRSLKHKELLEKMRKLYKDYEDTWYKEHNIIEDYKPEHKTILKKYADFPKMFKKLFNQEVTPYTDYLGNTWYEVTLPGNYLDMEWKYKNGGRLRRK